MNTNPTIAPMPAMPSRARKSAAPRKCECGCGTMTRGGRYTPGHDSRHKGWAIRIANGYDTTGIGPTERIAAIAYINARPELKAAHAATEARQAAEAQPEAQTA